MSRARQIDGDDLLLHETMTGMVDRSALVLYMVSLYGVRHVSGETVNGDVLLVRPRGTAEFVLLAAILGCVPEDVPHIIGTSGAWSIREVAEIDGHRIHFEAN